MGTGTSEAAAGETAYVMDTVRDKLIAFQLCKEPDLFYRSAIRKKDHDFAQIAMEWQRVFEAVRAKAPKAPFAGPDTAYNSEWLAPFAQRFKDEAAFLSQHYYALGPPEDPAMTIERMLSPDPKLAAELFRGFSKISQGRTNSIGNISRDNTRRPRPSNVVGRHVRFWDETSPLECAWALQRKGVTTWEISAVVIFWL